MAHPPALDPWSAARHTPQPAMGAAVARIHGMTRVMRALAVFALVIGVPSLGMGLSMLAAPVSEQAEQLGLLVALLLAVGGMLLNRRIWQAPDDPLVPSRLDDHQARLVDSFTPVLEQAARSLKAAGLTLLWAPGAGIGTLRLTEETTRGLLLIAREALDEVMRQVSRPGQVRLELDLLHGETGSHLRMAIIDTGRASAGPAPQAPSRGHELAMAQRHATQLGAQLDIGTDTTGWCAELVLQLAPA